MANKFEVEVLTPEGEVFSGEVSQVSTRTAVGEIGILANHARLLVEEAITPEDLDAAMLKEQLSDAEQRLAESEEGSAARGRAEKDRDRAQAFLALAQG